ncbi:RNA polymerase sigma factor [Bosea thiooxidans]
MIFKRPITFPARIARRCASQALCSPDHAARLFLSRWLTAADREHPDGTSRHAASKYASRAGDAMSWDLQHLFASYAREINRFLRRRGHSLETAEDLTQDTFVRVLASPPAEAGVDHNPRAYLYRVSRNLSINHHRRESIVPFADLTDEIAEIADPAPSPERIVHSRQCLMQVQKALAGLPERTRLAFEMHRIGDRTIAEVAQELGLSNARTWGLIHEAYRHLLEQVDDL